MKIMRTRVFSMQPSLLASIFCRSSSIRPPKRGNASYAVSVSELNYIHYLPNCVKYLIRLEIDTFIRRIVDDTLGVFQRSIQLGL